MAGNIVSNFIGAAADARLQTPFSIRPFRNTHAVPVPTMTGTGTTAPWESRAAVDCTDTDMITTSDAVTWLPSINVSALPFWVRRYLLPSQLHDPVAAGYGAVIDVAVVAPAGAAAL